MSTDPRTVNLKVNYEYLLTNLDLYSLVLVKESTSKQYTQYTPKIGVIKNMCRSVRCVSSKRHGRDFIAAAKKLPCPTRHHVCRQMEGLQGVNYSTVTLFARLRGWSTLQPRISAM